MIFTVEGVVENGHIKLDEQVKLLEHARVFVIVPDVAELPKIFVRSPRLANPTDAAHFKKKVFQTPNPSKS